MDHVLPLRGKRRVDDRWDRDEDAVLRGGDALGPVLHINVVHFQILAPSGQLARIDARVHMHEGRAVCKVGSLPLPLGGAFARGGRTWTWGGIRRVIPSRHVLGKEALRVPGRGIAHHGSPGPHKPPPTIPVPAKEESWDHTLRIRGVCVCARVCEECRSARPFVCVFSSFGCFSRVLPGLLTSFTENERGRVENAHRT